MRQPGWPKSPGAGPGDRVRGAVAVDLRTDRVLKFERYRAIPTLRQIVFVYQDSIRIESWLRQHDDWREAPVLLLRPEDSLAVPILGASLALADIYAGVRPGLYPD